MHHMWSSTLWAMRNHEGGSLTIFVPNVGRQMTAPPWLCVTTLLYSNQCCARSYVACIHAGRHHRSPRSVGEHAVDLRGCISPLHGGQYYRLSKMSTSARLRPFPRCRASTVLPKQRLMHHQQRQPDDSKWSEINKRSLWFLILTCGSADGPPNSRNAAISY